MGLRMMAGTMAIRAIISNGSPTPDGKFEDLWTGALGLDGDDGIGITTAAILSFLPTVEPGTWYSVPDFTDKVATAKWDKSSEEWTSLEIQQSTAEGNFPVSINLRLSDAVESLCLSTVEFLQSLDIDQIWVRFE